MTSGLNFLLAEAARSTLNGTRRTLIIHSVTKEDLIKRLKGLSKHQFAKCAPFIDADIEAADDLAALHKEIEAGRRSAATHPILEANDVYARVRQTCSKGS